MTGGRPVAEKYLKLMTELKNARISTAWWLLPINALVFLDGPDFRQCGSNSGALQRFVLTVRKRGYRKLYLLTARGNSQRCRNSSP